MRLTLVLSLLIFAFSAPIAHAEDAWDALRGGGVVALIRHTSAPDTGQEHNNVRLEDCSTQRLLSDQGRAEAEALGRMYRRAGVEVVRALASQWCRCLDTARLAFGDMAEGYRPLNTFHNHPAREPAQSADIRGIVRDHAGKPGVIAMVTHWQNLEALVGFKPREGETTVVRWVDGQLQVVGRIGPPAL